MPAVFWPATSPPPPCCTFFSFPVTTLFRTLSQTERHVIPAVNHVRHVSRPETVSSPQYQIGYPSMDERERREINNTTMGYEEAIDLEPIDFEHFIDEPDLDRPGNERMFRVTFGDGVMRGR